MYDICTKTRDLYAENQAIIGRKIPILNFLRQKQLYKRKKAEKCGNFA